jgi:hypothetical protein
VLNVALDQFSFNIEGLRYGAPHESSARNGLYGNYDLLTPWTPSTSAFDIVQLLPGNRRYPPVLRDPTIYIDLEASVVQLGQGYVLHSVNLILTDLICELGLGLEIRTSPEDSCQGLTESGKPTIARWDLGYQVRRVSGASWSNFAILEFKRPLSLTYKKWASAMRDSPQYSPPIGVQRPDLYIAQQSKKYNDVGKTPYVALYDWNSFVELINQDGLEENVGPKRPRISRALYRWTDATRESIRLRLFEFLFDALMWWLQQHPEIAIPVQQMQQRFRRR